MYHYLMSIHKVIDVDIIIKNTNKVAARGVSCDEHILYAAADAIISD